MYATVGAFSLLFPALGGLVLFYKKQDVEFLRNITWERGQKRLEEMSATGRGRRREIPLNDEARKSLNAWHAIRGDEGALLFSGKRGEGFSVSGVHRRLAELGRIAKVEVHAHTLRHTFSKNLIDSGVSLEKVASLLGHSSLNTTRIYTTPGERDLEVAVEQLVG